MTEIDYNCAADFEYGSEHQVSGGFKIEKGHHVEIGLNGFLRTLDVTLTGSKVDGIALKTYDNTLGDNGDGPYIPLEFGAVVERSASDGSGVAGIGKDFYATDGVSVQSGSTDTSPHFGTMTAVSTRTDGVFAWFKMGRKSTL